MSLRPCSFCSKRPPGKLASVFWAWVLTDGTRRCYRQRLCVECYVTNVAQYDVASDGQELRCPVCHATSEDDLDPIYATEFVPGHGKAQKEYATCAACAVVIRADAIVNAELMDERDAQFGGQGPGPQTNTPSGWDALGLAPR